MTTPAQPFPPCPRCGSTDALEIEYGYPSLEMGMAAERDEIVLGGCLMGDESPDYQCGGCGSPLPWVRPRDEDDDSDAFEFCGDAPLRYA